MGYSSRMVKILRTAEFDSWLDSLKDRLAKSSVSVRIDRLAKATRVMSSRWVKV